MTIAPDGKKKIQLIIEPAGKRILVPAGSNLLTSVQKAGIELIATCGGNGTCADCKIIPVRGDFSDLSPTERIGLSKEEQVQGMRLACQTYARGNVEIEVIHHVARQGR